MTGLKHNGCSTCNLQGGKVEFVGENDYLYRETFRRVAHCALQ